MIEVGVGEKDEIDFWKLPDGESRTDEALGAEGSEDEIDATARAEDRVCEDGEAIDLDEGGGVSEPGCVQTFGLPLLWLWTERGRRCWSLAVEGIGTETKCGRCGGGEDGAATNSQNVPPSKGPRAYDIRCVPRSQRGLRQGVRVHRAIWRSSRRRAGGRSGERGHRVRS